MEKIIEYGLLIVTLLLGAILISLYMNKASLFKKISFILFLLVFIIVTQFTRVMYFSQTKEIAYIANNSSFGCKNKEERNKLLTIASQKDKQSFLNELFTNISTGECTMFKENELVHIAESEFSGWVLLKRENSSHSYWTDFDVIKDIQPFDKGPNN